MLKLFILCVVIAAAAGLGSIGPWTGNFGGDLGSGGSGGLVHSCGGWGGIRSARAGPPGLGPTHFVCGYEGLAGYGVASYDGGLGGRDLWVCYGRTFGWVCYPLNARSYYGGMGSYGGIGPYGGIGIRPYIGGYGGLGGGKKSYY